LTKLLDIHVENFLRDIRFALRSLRKDGQSLARFVRAH